MTGTKKKVQISEENAIVPPNVLSLNLIQVQIVGAIFKFAKINTVHCIFTAALSQ